MIKINWNSLYKLRCSGFRILPDSGFHQIQVSTGFWFLVSSFYQIQVSTRFRFLLDSDFYRIQVSTRFRILLDLPSQFLNYNEVYSKLLDRKTGCKWILTAHQGPAQIFKILPWLICLYRPIGSTTGTVALVNLTQNKTDFISNISLYLIYLISFYSSSMSIPPEWYLCTNYSGLNTAWGSSLPCTLFRYVS